MRQSRSRLIGLAFGAALSAVACTSSQNSSTTYSFPLGAQLSGVTLSGTLAGKSVYLLPSTIDPSQCWNDSVKWTGSELFYGISNINWTELNAGAGVVIAAGCSPQPALSSPSTGYFNIYRGVVSAGAWTLSSLPLNVGITASTAAPSLSANTLAFVKYEKSGSYGNIYLSTRTGDNSYAAGTAYANDSTSCNDDNPDLYSSGTKMIFESNRSAPAVGSSCVSNKQTLWLSQISSGTWTTPTAVTGAPASATNSVTQPWIDETTGNLYWSATGSDCTGGAYTTCIQMATPSGGGWSATAAQIMTPTAVGSLVSGSVALVGQFTFANKYAFAVCGVLAPGAGPHYFVSNLAVFFNICAIPL